MLRQPKVRAELARAAIDSAEDLVGLFVLDGDNLRARLGPGPINTDDNALIEFAAPRDLVEYADRDAEVPFLSAVEGRRLELVPRRFAHFDWGPEAVHRMAYRLLGQGRFADARAFADEAEKRGEDTRRVFRLLEYMQEADAQPVIVAQPETKGDAAYAKSARAMLEGFDRRALAVVEAEDDFENRSLAHRFLYAFLCYRRERYRDAEYLIEPVVDDDTFPARYPSVFYYAGRIKLQRRAYREGLEYLERFDDALLSESM